MIYATTLVVANHDHYARPALGWALLGLMAAWTIVVTLACRDPARRTTPLLVADVAVAVGAVLATTAVETAARIDAGAPTVPAAWAASAVLACAVARGVWGGTLAALALAVADVVERGDMTEHTFNGIVLLLLAGAVGGYVVDLAVRAEAAVAMAARREAAVAERERLGRHIHDSVLQVLALVARRGREAAEAMGAGQPPDTTLSGRLAEVAGLAGEQERALRTFLATPAPSVDGAGEVDLRSLVEPLAGGRVTVSCPAEPVRLPEPVAVEVRAAVAEALANVQRHAGDDARAWVLVDDEGDAVAVSIRDDGPGFDGGRLDVARQDGRMGVAQSIIGRIAAVGGTASVSSSPGAGTEVELRVRR